MSTLFGNKVSKPKIQKVTPIQEVEPSELEKSDMIKLYAKKLRATMLNQATRQPQIKQQKLGAVM